MAWHPPPRVARAEPTADGRRVRLVVAAMVPGHVHEFDLRGLRAADGRALLHADAYYTVNVIPTK